ncbi:uncharacterized protein BJX67DRAFT_378324 [Aspergillus lucknowensis]|uniref:NmrA-like domain-containing protein n=1 Tax=Aspergillus lucknowensis TaxID=176173 RepID=A0ABR4M2U9_9EURO
MRIAIAGAGDLSRYFYEEFPRHGHHTIALTRTPKGFLSALSIEQRLTDYSVHDLTEKLSDCDAVISTIAASGPDHVAVHLALLEACKRTPRCKRMIPSEWTGNVERHPEQEPRYMHETREPIRAALRAQKNAVQWTIFLNGWFSEYVLPAGRRYFGDLEDGGWPVDFAKRVFTLYGDGRAPVTLTSARDTARAVAKLMEREDWEEFTHLAGETVTWVDLLGIVQRRSGGEWEVVGRSYEDAVRQVEEAEKDGKIGKKVNAQLQLLGYSDFNRVEVEKAKRQREAYFPDLHFRGVEEILDEAGSRGGVI